MSASNPFPLASIGDTLFFSADDGIHGRELWKSDGTAAGTTLVADIAPGSPGSDIRSAAALGDALYVVANDGTSGLELWKLDLVTEQIRLVRDIRSGEGAGSLPIELTAFQNELFFSALDDDHGRELWKTDGTEAGTSLVIDLLPGSGSGAPSNLTVFQDELIFSASGVVTSGNGRKQQNTTTGKELWKTDGTESGTILIQNLAAGSDSSSPSSLTVVQDQLYFVASGSTVQGKGKKATVIAQGEELWVTDATPEGTRLVKDVLPGENGSTPSFLTDVNGVLYFAVRGETGQRALWSSDGTDVGTRMVLDTSVFNGTAGGGSLPVVGTTLFFNSLQPGEDLFLSAFDAATTMSSALRSVLPAEAVAGGAEVTLALHEFAGSIFFTAFDPSTGLELWKADPETFESAILRDVFPGSSLSDPTPFRLHGVERGFFFAADDGVHGRELWFSDGTSAGTAMVLDIAGADEMGAGTAQHPSAATIVPAQLTTPVVLLPGFDGRGVNSPSPTTSVQPANSTRQAPQPDSSSRGEVFRGGSPLASVAYDFAFDQLLDSTTHDLALEEILKVLVEDRAWSSPFAEGRLP